MMPASRWTVPLCAASLAAAAPSGAATIGVIPNGYVLGDSLGEGVGEVSHLKSLAVDLNGLLVATKADQAVGATGQVGR